MSLIFYCRQFHRKSKFVNRHFSDFLRSPHFDFHIFRRLRSICTSTKSNMITMFLTKSTNTLVEIKDSQSPPVRFHPPTEIRKSGSKSTAPHPTLFLYFAQSESHVVLCQRQHRQPAVFYLSGFLPSFPPGRVARPCLQGLERI